VKKQGAELLQSISAMCNSGLARTRRLGMRPTYSRTTSAVRMIRSGENRWARRGHCRKVDRIRIAVVEMHGARFYLQATNNSIPGQIRRLWMSAAYSRAASAARAAVSAEDGQTRRGVAGGWAIHEVWSKSTNAELPSGSNIWPTRTLLDLTK
jgi:hypothetical protein